MSEATERFGLPLLVAGQGQKDVTHNEALLALDCLLGATVKSRALPSPPAGAEVGDCWLVRADAAGEWLGHGDLLACWTVGGWRFQRIPFGMQLWVQDERRSIRRGMDGFETVLPFEPALPAVLIPQGGTVIDAELRQAFGALVQRLEAAGLLST